MRTLSILLAIGALAHADDDKALDRAVASYVASADLPAIQVTATRLALDPFDTTRSVTVITTEMFAKRRPSVAVAALDQHPGLWVEQRTATTGDPVMRGFSGSNLLALIDGNTLTTLWGEGGFAGDDMYGKIDAYLIDRVEVVRGPASVLYGSNTLGGVINFITRSSRYEYTEEGFDLGGRVYIDFSSVDAGVRGRVEHHGASPNWRWLVGFTASDIEDVRGGGDVGIQTPSGGEDTHFDVKVQRRLGEEHEIEFFLQRADRDHTHRFYRPTQDNFNDRIGVGVVFRTTAFGPWAHDFEAKFYHQYKKDTRRFFDSDRRGVAKTSTTVLSFQASTPPGDQRLTYGLSWERDCGESPDDEQFTLHTTHMDDFVKDAPDSVWDDIGAYLQHEWQVAPRWMVTSAARVDLMRFRTEVDEFYDPPGPLDPADDRYTDNIAEVTGGIGVLFEANDDVHLVGNVSRGFRQFAPNFGARQQAAGILMPNRLLDAVTALSFEVGAKIRKESWWLDAFVYRTELYDFQNQVFGTFDGADFFDFNQNGMFDPEERVLLNVADGRAYVNGVELEGWCHLADFFSCLPEGLSVRGGFAWNFGNDRTRDEPLRHVHPTHGILTLRYEDPSGRWWCEFGTTMVAKASRIPSDRVAKDPGFRSDPQDITSPLLRADGSLPGYTVFDIRGGFRINDNARVEIALENVTDKKYRRLHSRMDAPGFGIRVGATVDF